MKIWIGLVSLFVMILALAGCGGSGVDFGGRVTETTLTVRYQADMGDVYYYTDSSSGGGYATPDGYELASLTLGRAPAGTFQVNAGEEASGATWKVTILGWQPDSGRGGPSGSAEKVAISYEGKQLTLTPKHLGGKEYVLVLTDSRDKDFSLEITDSEDVARQIYGRLITRGGGPESTVATTSAFYVSYALGF